MELQQFLEENFQLKFLKWTEIITQESQAVKNDSMYIIPKDQTWCDVIFIDANGNKRKVGGTSYEEIVENFALLDASNLSATNITEWREKLDIQDPSLNVLNFFITDDMHLMMNLETNTNLNFTLDDNGHLILTN